MMKEAKKKSKEEKMSRDNRVMMSNFLLSCFFCCSFSFLPHCSSIGSNPSSDAIVTIYFGFYSLSSDRKCKFYRQVLMHVPGVGEISLLSHASSEARYLG